MASHGIKDRVAIIGMGCTPFVEHWDLGSRRPHRRAPPTECFASAGVDKDDVDAYWLGTAHGGMSGITLARPLQLIDKPVTRVENYCATGSEALRQAAYAVASGAYDVAMALGVEKTKDSGYQGLNATPPPNDGTGRTLTAAAMFSMVAPAYAHRYGVDAGDGVARRWPASRGRTTTTAPATPGPVPPGGLDRDDHQVRRGSPASSASSTAPASPTARPRRSCAGPRTPTGTPRPSAVREGALVRRRQRQRAHRPGVRLHDFPEIVACAADAYAQAGITDPAAEIALAEVHDCFTITELVLMEDLGFSERGTAWSDVLDGRFDLARRAAGEPRRRAQVVRPPGRRVRAADDVRGLAAAPRRSRRRAPDRTDAARHSALTHNLGGYPGEMVSFVSILGTEPG